MQLKNLIVEIDSLAKKECSKKRYEHIRRVKKMAISLAKFFGVNKQEAALVALAHDLAREWSGKQLLAFVNKNGYKPRKIESKKPVLLHGRCAALLLRHKYKIKKGSILRAIEDHTLGRWGMEMLGILLYVSDYIEPGRRYVSKKFRGKIVTLSPWEMVIAVNKHAKKRNKRMSPLTRQLHSYAKEMLSMEKQKYREVNENAEK